MLSQIFIYKRNQQCFEWERLFLDQTDNNIRSVDYIKRIIYT